MFLRQFWYCHGQKARNDYITPLPIEFFDHNSPEYHQRIADIKAQHEKLCAHIRAARLI
jgi:hypothetical protein